MVDGCDERVAGARGGDVEDYARRDRGQDLPDGARGGDVAGEVGDAIEEVGGWGAADYDYGAGAGSAKKGGDDVKAYEAAAADYKG